mgnify:CR=1 FL=1
MLSWSKLVFGSFRKTTCNPKKSIMYLSRLRCSANLWRRPIYLWAKKSWLHLWYLSVEPFQDPCSLCGARSVGNSSNAPKLSNKEMAAKKRVKVPHRKILRRLISLKRSKSKGKLALQERKKTLKIIHRVKCPRQPQILLIPRLSQTEILRLNTMRLIIMRNSATSTFSHMSFCAWFAILMTGCH